MAITRLEERQCRLVVVGHSYVGGLMNSPDVPENFVLDTRAIAVSYEGQPGATHRELLDDPHCLNNIQARDPHYVVVILGGNEVGSPMPVDQIKEDLRQFYHALRMCAPQAIIISVQVETRSYQEGNSWQAPTGPAYHSRRNIINLYLKKYKGKDFLCCIGGPGNMDNLNLYESKSNLVHLKPQAIPKYWNEIVCTLSYVHKCIDWHLACTYNLERISARLGQRRRGQ